MVDLLERMSTVNSLAEPPSLSSIREKLTAFENSLLNSKIRQKEEEDDKFNKIHGALCALNEQLVRESQERLASREALQRMTEEAANRMLNSVQKKLNSKVHLLAERLDVLIDKCVALENSVNDMEHKLNKSSYLEMVEGDISDISNCVRNDIIAKADKDTSILDKICFLENSNKIKINDNNIWNSECIAEIRDHIHQLKQSFEGENELFLKYITVELGNVRRALKSTTSARKHSDHYILQAIDQMMSFLPMARVDPK